ncbi:MAG: TRAP transporter substrate-binding protein DctP [Chloroflexota bacterium]
MDMQEAPVFFMAGGGRNSVGFCGNFVIRPIAITADLTKGIACIIIFLLFSYNSSIFFSRFFASCGFDAFGNSIEGVVLWDFKSVENQSSNLKKKGLNQMKKKLLPLTMLLMAILIFNACASPAPAPAPTPSPAPPAQPIVMNWVSFLPQNEALMVSIQKYVFNKINERAKGQLVINYRGGPESIAAFDQAKAVQDGIVDISALPVGFYEPLVPGVGAYMLSQLSLDDERNGGAVEYLQGIHQAGGLFYLGRGVHASGGFFITAMNEKVLTKEDFPKVKIASATSSRAAVIGWGAAHVSTNPGEFYTVMERGVADGLAGTPTTTLTALGMQAVTKYVIDHPYYQNTVTVLMNRNSWDKLPQNLKDIVMSSMVEAEKEIQQVDAQDRVTAKQTLEAAGVEFYKFAPDVASWYLQTAYDAAWADQTQRFPDVTAKLRPLITQK